jgi:hypothetical protein
MSDERMMTSKEVADWLNISTRTVARLDKELRPSKVRTRKRYKRSIVQAYIDRTEAKNGASAGTRETTEEE